MSFEPIPGTDRSYGLISFDGEGHERPENGMSMSVRLTDLAGREPITNIFFFCHGWKGDVPAARDQYAHWLKAFWNSADRQRASQVFPDFYPLLIGLHWPSQPWGDEQLGGVAFGMPGGLSSELLLEAYLKRLGNREAIRAPLRLIIDEARRNIAPDRLPEHVRQAYADLNDALGLKSEGVGAPPDADREGFDPDLSYEAGNEEAANFGDLKLGGLLGPLRQLSYWAMKKRARTVGEGGMHIFLKALEEATAPRRTHIHLMGHSFGTIVVSGMLRGPDAASRLPRPVDSVVLIQGAVSLWCYAASIPFPDAGPGYFSQILGAKKVRGPIVATRSRNDTAVGVLYPLASRLKGSASFALGQLPKFGAVGTFGLQGIDDALRNDRDMVAGSETYSFGKQKVYNLESSRYIGGHSDIAGPEVAHAIWEAAFAAV